MRPCAHPVWSQTILGITVAGLGLGLISCTESKVSQCNRLIEVANQAVAQVQDTTQNADPDDVEAFLQIADTADQAAADLEALDLKDDQLQTYKGQFITMYSATSEATRSLVDAVNSQDTAAAQDAYSSLQTATSQESGLVDAVNTYCGG